MKKDYRLKSESVDFSNPIFKNNSRLHQTVFPKQFKDDMLYSKLYRDINRKNNSRISKNHLPNLSNSNNNIPLNTENSPLISTHKTFIPENVDSVLKTAHNFVNKSPFKNRLNVDVNKIIKEDEKERNVLITPCKNYESTNNKDKFSKERINDLHKLENINKKKEKIVRKTQNQFYCPFCEHCNKFEDPFFDNYIFSINEAKNFLSKSVEYIVNSGIITKENLDFFESSSSNIMQENAPKEKKISQNDASLISKNQTKEIETFINAIPKSIVNSRSTYTILSHFLNALIEDKLSLDYIASPDIMNKLNDSLISVGYSFIEVNNTLEFDKELETLFDERTMKMIKKLFEKKHINMGIAHEEKSRVKKEDFLKMRKRFLVLFLIFLQILKEISSECKERAILLYKFFKLYFVEQEKKWLLIIDKMKDKVHYYKALCKNIIQQKNKYIEKIESVNEILFTNKVTLDNLMQHKKLIHELFSIINEKREDIYLMQSQIEIYQKEIKFWLWDFDTIKINPEIRKKMTIINSTTNALVQNVDLEMAHKSISKEEKSFIINADRFLIASGQRGYFYEQKKNLTVEIERLNKLYMDYYYKKKTWKKKYEDREEENFKKFNKLDNEINAYKNKEMCLRIDIGCETDIDFYEMNKILMNHDSILYFKKIKINKLGHFLDRVKYNASREKPISKKSLLYLIPEVYNEKFESDNHHETEKKKKLQLDHLFYELMTFKFKLKKLIKKHCEETIMSVIKYSSEDYRIDLFGKFMGITDVKYRREILDLYLSLMKSQPISLYKLYDEVQESYFMDTELCFEIYFSKFKVYEFTKENTDNILKLSILTEGEKEINSISNEKKLSYFLLSRCLTKSTYMMNQIIADFKNNVRKYIDLKSLYKNFSVINVEIFIPEKDFSKIVNRVLSIEQDDNIELEEIIKFHNKRYGLKIKVTDFLQISLNSIINTYDFLEKKIIKIFDQIDIFKTEIFTIKEFLKSILIILGVSENEWKINEYFSIALNGQLKDFLNKEEFIVFCLNEKDIISALLKLVRVPQID